MRHLIYKNVRSLGILLGTGFTLLEVLSEEQLARVPC
jgi:hypothetical protein